MAVFVDAPEYSARSRTPFALPPSSLTIKAVHDSVPKHLFQRSTAKCLFYVGRHVFLCACFYLFAAHINNFVVLTLGAVGVRTGGRAEYALDWAMWATYWFWQSVAFMGIWTLGERLYFAFFDRTSAMRTVLYPNTSMYVHHNALLLWDFVICMTHSLSPVFQSDTFVSASHTSSSLSSFSQAESR